MKQFLINGIKKTSTKVIDDHLYFKILRKNNINFYNSKRTLEPLKIESSHFDNIEKKVMQIERYISKNDLKNDKVKKDILNLKSYLVLNQSSLKDKDTIQDDLINAEISINNIIDEVEKIKTSLTKFDKRRPYYVIGKRLEELGELTSKEINSENNSSKNLLFDPEYD